MSFKCPNCIAPPYHTNAGLKTHLRYCTRDAPLFSYDDDGQVLRLCSICQAYKPLTAFRKDNTRTYGVGSSCRKCNSRGALKTRKKRKGTSIKGNVRLDKVKFRASRNPNWVLLKQDARDYLEAGFELVTQRPPDLSEEDVVIGEGLYDRMLVISFRALNGCFHVIPRFWVCASTNPNHSVCTIIQSVIFE